MLWGNQEFQKFFKGVLTIEYQLIGMSLYYSTHQVRHTCKAHYAGAQKPTLQKSLPCSYASGTHPATVDTYFNLKHQDEGRTYNMGIA